MLRAIAEKLRLERLRQLWMQCDLFDTLGTDDRATAGRPASPHPAHVVAPPKVRPARPRKARKGRKGRKASKPKTADPAAVETAKRARMPRTHRDDVEFVHRLQESHAEYNQALFDNALKPVVIRVSRRMKNRLGHYMEAGRGLPAEIAISRQHITRDPWDDVLHTLVHEMVHQWQDENGYALDHSQIFRRKAREVGISVRATRPADFAQRPRMAARAVHRRTSHDDH